MKLLVESDGEDTTDFSSTARVSSLVKYCSKISKIVKNIEHSFEGLFMNAFSLKISIYMYIGSGSRT